MPYTIVDCKSHQFLLLLGIRVAKPRHNARIRLWSDALHLVQLLKTSQKARRRTGGGNGFRQSGLQGETFRDVFDTGCVQPVQPGVCLVANSVRVDEDLESKRTEPLHHDRLDFGPFEPAVSGCPVVERQSR